MKVADTMTRIPVLVLIVLAGLTSSLLFVHRIETGGDNLDFLLMTKSLQAGQRLDVIGWPRPFGYALVTMSLFYLTGMPIDEGGLFVISNPQFYALKALGVLMFVVSSLAVYGWSTTVTRSRHWGFGIALLFASNQHLAAWFTVIGSESLMIMLVFLGLYCWERYAAPNKPNAIKGLFGFVVFTIAAMFSKHQGLMLGVSFGLWVLLYRRASVRDWLAGGILLIFFSLSIGFTLMGNPFVLTHVVSEDPYRSGDAVSWTFRLATALQTYTLPWADLTIPKVFGSHNILDLLGLSLLRMPLLILVLMLIVAGLVISLRHRLRPSHLFLLCYYIMLFGWPDFLFRYLMPLLPFGLWFFCEGLRACVQAVANRGWLSGALPHRITITIITSIVMWNMAVNTFAGIKNWRNIIALKGQPAWAPERYRISREDDFADYIEGCMWFHDHVPSDAFIFSRKALFAELAAGRRSEYYTSYATPDELWQAMQASAKEQPTYVLRDTFDPSSTYGRMREQLLMPVLEQHADNMNLIHRMAAGQEIYQILFP